MTREPDHNQTLIAAENGPVIEADDTGLVLRLSDRVIRDIARRIGLPAAPEAAPEAAPALPASATVQRLDAALLGDIDAWDLQREGEWLRFLAHRPGPQGARRYRRHASGGGIIAETPGPVLGLLSLGAGRRMTTFGGTPDFPHHVMACHVPDEGEPDHPVHGWRNRSADTMLAETTNLADSAPMDRLRDELVRNAAELGLDLSGAGNPADGINAMMAVDGSVVLAGGARDAHYWAYGADAAKVRAEPDSGHNTLWYLGGPNDFVLQMPPHMDELRVATVVARPEGDEAREGRTLRIVGHPDSPFRFESSERVSVHVVGSNGDDVMIGQKYGGSTFHGLGGDDLLVATSKRPKDRNLFHGGSGNDTLIGGPGPDSLYGGSGDDVIQIRGERGLAMAGPGNDVIRASDGKAEIDAGPGRNTIELGAGTHRVTLGPGPNRIVAGPGAKRFILERGATVALTGWDKAQRYVLKDWSGPVQQRVLDGGEVMIFAATSCLVVTDCPPGLDLVSQVEGEGA